MTRKFTDEEFEASDRYIDPEYAENENALLNMKSIQFAVTHSHENESINLTQRYVEQYLTPDGFSEERPRQTTMTIPMDHWHAIMLEAMINIGCIITAKEEGESRHDG